jgi:tetraacyldisaccharide 4'-kinase
VFPAVARARRRFYTNHPDRQRRLARPVISIGNLALGGRAKTPIVAAVAARLRDAGERPAILSRGYARHAAPDGVVVVRDAEGIRADLDRAGDEPLMLARQLEGVSVLACSSRYLAGRLAEQHLNSTVHILDDGFQHLTLRRDVDIVIVAADDLERPRTLPFGRLREPMDALFAADAVVALDDAPFDALGRGIPIWRAGRRLDRGRLVEPFGAPVEFDFGSAVAIAGIANPSRFFADLRSSEWPLARELPYADHHRYSRKDVDDIFRAVQSTGAGLVITTEKDLVRLLPFRPFPAPVAWVPLKVSIEPQPEFDHWLLSAVAAARGTIR